MCGICGIFHLDKSDIDKKALYAMVTSAEHRGPDDEGYLLMNTQAKQVRSCYGKATVPEMVAKMDSLFDEFRSDIGFGFRRLSILDLSTTGHQPMADSGRNVWIIFNGEIYNFVELRTELSKIGYPFRSHTDTEVILNAYLEWGESCLQRFNGMFAFSLWDSRKNRLFCARDRVGIKPFYFYKDDGRFIWASEIKQLVCSGLIEIKANFKNIYTSLLMSRHNINKKTFFENIVELPPAHYLTIEEQSLRIVRYWDLDESDQLYGSSDDEYAEQFLDIFTNAVRLRLRSDVPLGIALSGGLDSSSIACVTRKLSQEEVRTFSVYYEEDKVYDERQYISEVIKQGNFEPTYFTSKGQFEVAEIERWIYHQDEPPTGASPFSAFNNYRNVRNAGITVALNGQGGDEILAGYDNYLKYYQLDLLKQAKFFKFLQTLRTSGRLARSGEIRKVLLRLILPDSLLKKFEKYEVANQKYFTREFLKQRTPVRLRKKYSRELNNILYNSLTVTSIPHLLHWEDRNSMAFSVESRVPFLDHNLIEFMFKLPVNQKIRQGETKVVLRNAMKNILPEKVRLRKDKVGFATPTDIWTTGELRGCILDIFHSQSFRERGIFNSDLILQDYEKNPQLFKPNEVWKFFSLELWFRRFIDEDTR